MTSPGGGSADVEAYIAAAPEESAERMRELRRRIRALVPDTAEQLRYGMPSFRLASGYHVYFANWKAHIGLYPIPRGEEAFELMLAPYRDAKDTVKLLHRRPVPWEVVDAVLAHVVARNRGEGGGA